MYRQFILVLKSFIHLLIFFRLRIQMTYNGYFNENTIFAITIH